MAISKSIPAKHTGPGVSCRTRSGQEYRISQDPTKMEFTLWKVVHGGFERMLSAKSPIPLYEKVPWQA